MPKRFLPRALCAFSAMLALGSFAYEPEVDDPVGPPLVTRAGCRADQPFTPEYVASVIGVPKSVVMRMLKRYGFHPWQVCGLDAKRLAPLIEATRMNKFGYDEPNEA